MDEEVMECEARSATPAEIMIGDFYQQWALETEKSSIEVGNKILHTLLTVGGSLAGGSAVFWRDVCQPCQLQAVVVGLFAGSFAAALWGMLPMVYAVNLMRIDTIRLGKRRVLRKKVWAAWVSAVLLLLAVLAAVVSLFNRS